MMTACSDFLNLPRPIYAPIPIPQLGGSSLADVTQAGKDGMMIMQGPGDI
jgi:hypothetical protein